MRLQRKRFASRLMIKVKSGTPAGLLPALLDDPPSLYSGEAKGRDGDKEKRFSRGDISPR